MGNTQTGSSSAQLPPAADTIAISPKPASTSALPEPYSVTYHRISVGQIRQALLDSVQCFSNDVCGIVAGLALGFQGECKHVLKGHSRAVISMCVLNRGRHLATASSDHIVRVWDLESGECISRMATLEKGGVGHVSRQVAMCAVNEGKWLCVGNEDGQVSVYDPLNGQCVEEVSPNTRVALPPAAQPACARYGIPERTGVNLAPASCDGRLVASVPLGGKMRIYDVKTGKCVHDNLQGDPCVTCTAVVGGGRWLACGGDNSVHVWDMESGKLAHKHMTRGDVGRVLQRGERNAVTALAALGGVNGTRFACCSAGPGNRQNVIQVWDVESGKCVRELKGHSDRVRALASLDDGRLLASGSDDHTVRIWDVGSGACLHTLHGHSTGVVTLVAPANGAWLASGSMDKTVVAWDPIAGTRLTKLRGHRDWLTSLTTCDGGAWLASAAKDNTVRVWV